MKIILLFSFLISLTSFGQIIIDTSDHPHIGTTYAEYVLDTSVSITKVAATGPNMIWDFSVANDSVYIGQSSFTDPSNYPQSSYFPNANLVENDINEDSLLWFYSSSSAGLYAIGDYDLRKNEIAPVELYSPGQPSLKTPLAFGDTFTLKSTFYDGTIDSANSDGFVIYKVSVDGWGTLKLPGNLTYNVLKANQIEYSGRRNYKYINEVKQYVGDTITDSALFYKWFTNNTDFPNIAEANILYFLSPIKISFIYFPSLSKPPVSITGVTNSLSSGFEVYPNPSSGIINVVVDKEGCTLKLINIIGVELKLFYLEHKRSYIDLGNIPEGVYYLLLSNGQQSTSQKLIIQR